MQRRHKFSKPATIQLTSLIDILTVLVFFLLVNSQNVTSIPDSKHLVLPKSTAERRPNDVLTVTINADSIIVEGVPVIDTPSATATQGDLIPALAQELEYRASKTPPKVNAQGIPEREILVMGDRNTPYQLLRKVMATCSAADYSKISFAVLRAKEGST